METLPGEGTELDTWPSVFHLVFMAILWTGSVVRAEAGKS